jgi:hypothetical protein
MSDPVKNGKNTGGRFQKGNAGRRKGAKNKRTVWLEQIASSDLDAVVKAVLKKAKEGDTTAARLLLDRVWPAPKSRKVTIDVPAITNSGDLVKAMSAITAAMAGGEIDPSEAQQIAAVLEGHRKIIDTVELAERIAALETKIDSKERKA